MSRYVQGNMYSNRTDILRDSVDKQSTFIKRAIYVRADIHWPPTKENKLNLPQLLDEYTETSAAYSKMLQLLHVSD